MIPSWLRVISVAFVLLILSGVSQAGEVMRWTVTGGANNGSFVPMGPYTDYSAAVSAGIAQTVGIYPGYTCSSPPKPATPLGVQAGAESVCSKPYSSYIYIRFTGIWHTVTCTAPEVFNSTTGLCEAPCPSGQTRVNGVCTCDTGAQTGTDGTCCPVAGSGGGAPMQWCYVDSSTASTCDSAGTNGCKVRCSNVTFQKGAGLTVQIYPKQALGQSCSYTGTKSTNQGGGPLNNDELKEVSAATKDPAKANSPETCLASGQGYVTTASGTSCVSGGDTGVTKKETDSSTSTDGTGTTTETKTKETEQTPTGGTESETTVKTNPDGSTTTTTKKTTCADDGTCSTETTETTKDPSGNTTGAKGGTDNKSASNFCKENPDSELCKGTSDTCKDHPDRIGCSTFGEVTEQSDLAQTEKGISSITVAGVASNASCPADLTLAHGMTFSFAPFCNYATALSPIIITLAWLSAGFLIFGFKD